MPPINTSTQPTTAVIIERLDILSKQITDLTDKIECLTKEQQVFMVQYTRAHVELEAEVKRVSDKTDEAHKRIDKLAAGAWALAFPVILGALAFLWGIITHTITIGAHP